MAETQKNETTNQEVTFIIIQAINECIKEHVLEDFFREHRDEVIKMADLDYTWERREELIRAEEFEEGVTCGMEQGIEALVETCRELGVSETDTIARLMQKFELTREKAEEAYKRYTV